MKISMLWLYFFLFIFSFEYKLNGLQRVGIFRKGTDALNVEAGVNFLLEEAAYESTKDSYIWNLSELFADTIVENSAFVQIYIQVKYSKDSDYPWDLFYAWTTKTFDKVANLRTEAADFIVKIIEMNMRQVYLDAVNEARISTGNYSGPAVKSVLGEEKLKMLSMWAHFLEKRHEITGEDIKVDYNYWTTLVG